VASLLQQGRTTAEIAGILAISVNTARVHLNALLSKTGTRRQPALMRLMMGLPTVSQPPAQDERITRIS
jgi:DNA-binding CsgD family transcriptional regulator